MNVVIGEDQPLFLDALADALACGVQYSAEPMTWRIIPLLDRRV